MKIDMHIHSEYSDDSDSKIEDIIKRAIKTGLDGIAITDHNSIRGSKAAQEFVKRNKINLLIIPGIEIKTNAGDILAYNINEEIEEKEIFSVIKKLREMEAIIGIPHPFDKIRGSAIKKKVFDKIFREVDFVEINSRSLPFMNKKTRKFAEKYNLKIIGGSDAHFLNEIGKVHTIMDIEKNNFDVKKIMGNGSYFSIINLIKTKIKKLFS